MRGKHANRPHVLPKNVIDKIDEHIRSFPQNITHYKPAPTVYLDATLTVVKMHTLFIQKHPDLITVVKYDYYNKYFNTNFGYKFRRPQVDVCSYCEDLNVKKKSNTQNDNTKRVAIAELIIHKRRAKEFYNNLKEVDTKCKNNPDVMGIVFDYEYMQNLPLPFYRCKKCFT